MNTATHDALIRGDLELRRDAAIHYLSRRTGTLEYRFQRYAAVADELEARGLNDQSLIVDLGAGFGDFAFYLRAVRGYKGRYLPVDAAIDGVDLVTWTPNVALEFVTCIEVLEHLPDPGEFLARVLPFCGVFVATTPNTDELGADRVREIDLTHVRPIWKGDLERWGAKHVESRSFFGNPADSILAVWE